MLHGVAESCRKGSYRILQKPLNHLPSNLHLCIRGNVGTLIFQKYNGDEERIYLTGTSAGASLCVYLAAMMQSPELADVFGVVPADLGIRAMGLASGMYYTTKNGQHRNFSSFLYLRKRVEEKFLLSIHKSGKQSDSRTLAAVLSYHSLWRFPAKLQQTICQGHTEVRRHLPSGRSGSPQKTSSCIQYRPAGDPGKPICK
mgnify:CR=1 FL=1